MIRTKTIITTFMTLLFVITIVSCQQEPTARFVTDKSEYIAGETVHLTNTSSDGSSFQWTMPDGQTLNTNNADYLINVNDSFETLTFKLEAFSKNGKKTNSTSSDISVIPSSVFSVGNISLRPFYLSKGALTDKYFIYATIDKLGLRWGCCIYLYGNVAPSTSLTYNLVESDTLVTGQAKIVIEDIYDAERDFNKYISVSGQVQIAINNGKLHCIFNNIDAVHTSSPTGSHPNVIISGDITCH